jgi:hypothetical protein
VALCGSRSSFVLNPFLWTIQPLRRAGCSPDCPGGIGQTTVEFKISLVRPITPETGLIIAKGVVLNCGRRIGTAEGRITDSSGRLLAHGTNLRKSSQYRPGLIKLRTTRTDIAAIDQRRERDFRITFAAIITTTLGIAFLIARTAHWL